jgi:hypothetical protein
MTTKENALPMTANDSTGGPDRRLDDIQHRLDKLERNQQKPRWTAGDIYLVLYGVVLIVLAVGMFIVLPVVSS